MNGCYIALIPAYKPEAALMLPMLRALTPHFARVVVVDDGGGDAYRAVFERVRALEIDVVTHTVNLGKGRALKSGLNHILLRYPDCDGVVTADCDGQHAVEDILAVRDALARNPDRLVLGGRAFTGEVGAKSRIGNATMRFLYAVATGIKIYDTQTGLRGLPRLLFARLLQLSGERYEYETNMLLKLREWEVSPLEVPIKTIYINDNRGSHYHPVRDSIRIGARMLLFCLGSVVSFVADYALFILFAEAFGWAYWLSFGAARVFSAAVNYSINAKFVFGGGLHSRTLAKYYLLAGTVMGLGMLVMELTAPLGLPVLVKLCYDILMYVVNYFVQRDFVFKKRSRRGAAL